MSERGRIVAVFVLLTLIWGTTWAAIRVALEGIPPLAAVSARFTIAGLALLVWARFRGVRLEAGARERRVWIVNALLSFVGSYGLVYWAEQTLPSGLTAIFFATFPLWVAILRRWFVPGEKRSRYELLGVALGFAGTAVLFSEDLDGRIGAGALAAAIAMLVAPFFSAVASLSTKRWGSGMPPESIAAVSMLLGGLALAPVAAIVERDRVWSTAPGPWLATLYLAICGSAVTFPLYFWLLARRSTVTAALISYTAPVLAVAIGVAFLDEPITLRLLVGAAGVLAGVAWALRPERKVDPSRTTTRYAALR